MKKIIFTLFLTCFSYAAEFRIDKLPANYYKYDKEFQEVAEKYDIPMLLLKSIALTENTKMNKNIKVKNKNKTYDYGLMQVNTIWLKKFNISEKEALKPKTNIEMAAKILTIIINDHGYSWDAIGRYHSATEKHKQKWIKKVQISTQAIAKLGRDNEIVQNTKDVFAFLTDPAYIINAPKSGRKPVLIDIPTDFSGYQTPAVNPLALTLGI